MALLRKLTPEEFLNLQRRFWSKVRRGPQDACWEWLASRDQDGYGKFKVRNKTTRANRVAYELSKGPISKGMIILHKCDNPPCVNPNHLSIGTYKENHDDMVSKGRKKLFFGDENGARKHPERLKRGEEHGRAKLNWDIIRDIRETVAKKQMSQRKLAKKYGVSPTLVSLIVRRKIWIDDVQ